MGSDVVQTKEQRQQQDTIKALVIGSDITQSSDILRVNDYAIIPMVGQSQTPWQIPDIKITPDQKITPNQKITPEQKITPDQIIPPETKTPPPPYIPPPTIIPPLFPLPPLGGGGGGGGAAAAKPGRGSSFSARYNYGQGIGDMFGSMRPLNFSKSAPAPRKKSRRK
jgi:hypothetical protein